MQKKNKEYNEKLPHRLLDVLLDYATFWSGRSTSLCIRGASVSCQDLLSGGRYASLFFVCAVDPDDNELIALELIHQFVEVLDRYFGNVRGSVLHCDLRMQVCELDLVFNFHKAYYLIDEMILAGEIQESSKKSVLRAVNALDALIEAGDAKPE